MTKKKKTETKPPIVHDTVVLYVDGGASPVGKFGGFGVHGYLANSEEPKTGAGCSKAILTASGYVAKKQVTKKDKSVTVDKYYDYWCALPKIDGVEVTNNIAELKGFRHALTFILEKARGDRPIENLTIRPDSEYVIKGITKFVHNWVKQNWCGSTGQPVKNCELWKEIYGLYMTVKDTVPNVNIEWVKGHSGDVGNTKADALATTASNMARRGKETSKEKYSDAKGYWSTTKSYNRFLNKPFLYFTTNVDNTRGDEHIYRMATVGSKLHLNGKKISDAHYSVLLTKTPSSPIDGIIKAQEDVFEDGDEVVVIAKCAEIFRPDVSKLIEESPDQLIHIDETKDLYTPTELQLTDVQIPALLSYRQMDYLGTLETMLHNYREGLLTDPKKAGITDITDLIYDVKASKKKSSLVVKKSLPQSVKTLEVTTTLPGGGTKKLSLAFELDIPNRNTLSAIADTNPKVLVVTWPTVGDKGFKYATIVESEDNLLINSAIFSNVVLL